MDAELNNFWVRPVINKDWPILFSWFNRQGWVTGNSFVIQFAAEMKHCHLMVIVDCNDTPLSFLFYAVFQAYVYIGHYITDPDLRGRGIGSMLWKKVTKEIGLNMNYHIKSSGLMTEKYKNSSNFNFLSDVKCYSYVGKLDIKSIDSANQNEAEEFKVHSVLDKNIIEDLIQYDAEVRREDIADFLTIWLQKCQLTLSNPEPQVFTVYAKNQSNKTVGYGSIVHGHNGRRIGPLLADNFGIFLNLLKHLVSHYFVDETEQNQELSLTVPSTNTEAIKFFIYANFELRLELDRIFTKQVVDPRFEKIFCFAGQLGVLE